MAELKNDLIEDVKDRLSVEDVIGDYLELKRAGRNLKALSPFNPEKTASFMVSPEKQIWHDFSSGRGGNMFSFVMEMEGVEFRQALELLARKAGLDISQYRRGSGNLEKRKQRLISTNEQSAKFYQTQLVHNPKALEYVTKKRGFNKESIKAFAIGYSPSKGGLVEYLRSKNFTDKEIKDAGLASDRYKSLRDVFRGRMMIALHDPQGQTIGFTARLIKPDENAPKYINTPQTLVYDKSRHVYGFSQAKDAIRRAGFVVVAEGNLDVVSSHQAGIKNVVATAGTAITKEHLKILSRLTADIRLSFDADIAGIEASERAIALAQEIDVQLSIITVPEGSDPDDLIRSDLSQWQELIAQPEYAIDWLYNRHMEQSDLSTAPGKKTFSDLILKTISRLKDPVEKDHYLGKLAKDTNSSEESIKSKLFNLKQESKRLRKPKKDLAGSTQTSENIYEDQFLGLLILYPTTRRVAQTSNEQFIFSKPGRQKIYDYLMAEPLTTIDDMNPPQGLQDVAEYVKLCAFTAEQQYRSLGSNERLREANTLANKLIEQSKKNQRQKLISDLQHAEADADEARAAELMAEIDKLNRNS